MSLYFSLIIAVVYFDKKTIRFPPFNPSLILRSSHRVYKLNNYYWFLILCPTWYIFTNMCIFWHIGWIFFILSNFGRWTMNVNRPSIGITLVFRIAVSITCNRVALKIHDKKKKKEIKMIKWRGKRVSSINIHFRSDEENWTTWKGSK